MKKDDLTRLMHIACCFVFDEEGRILLLKRAATAKGGGKWGPPGGKVDRAESAVTAAARELSEEAGITLPVHSFELLGSHVVHMPHGSVIMDSFQTVLRSNKTVNIHPREHEAFDWFHVSVLGILPDLLWGVPTVLHDFDIQQLASDDPTLYDGSRVELLS